MIYYVTSEVKIMFGGWPSWSKVFCLVKGKNLTEATQKAQEEADKSGLEFTMPLTVEYNGIDYYPKGHDAFKFLGIQFKKDDVVEVDIFDQTKTIIFKTTDKMGDASIGYGYLPIVEQDKVVCEVLKTLGIESDNHLKILFGYGEDK